VTIAIFVLVYLVGIGKKAQPVRIIDISILLFILILGITSVLSIEPHRSWISAAGISGGLLAMLATREIVRRWFSGNQILAGLLVTGSFIRSFLPVKL